MHRSPNNCPEYPRGRLSMVKHRWYLTAVLQYLADLLAVA
jgi:hypothetical protein